ncbi:MAG: hypothetical protein ACOX9B_02255 [Candidatus Xenobium sp.]|nr:hypothetical protein [Burkholderiales bacterium]
MSHGGPVLPSATRREPRGYPACSAHDISSADAGKNRAEVDPEQEPGMEVVADLSSGSSATTLLCRREGRLFYRKFVFGEDKDRLFAQTEHLIHLAQAGVPVTPILEVLRDEAHCRYDMPYRDDAVDFFTYLHTHTPGQNRAKLVTILDSLAASIHADAVPASPEAIDSYIQHKIVARVEALLGAGVLAPILAAESLLVNGIRMPNLPSLAGLLEPARLRELLAHDKCARVHGDLTVENIICCEEEGTSSGFYLIDPNGGNLLDTPLLDHAKLLQSFHGGYEFLVRLGSFSVRTEGRFAEVDFPGFISPAYARLKADLDGYLRLHLSESELTAAYLHEVVHWLRLMPYKLRSDPARAPVFYAVLVRVLHTVARRVGW